MCAYLHAYAYNHMQAIKMFSQYLSDNHNMSQNKMYDRKWNKCMNLN